MKTYITSDLHFDHKGIMQFCPATRPFTDVDHMNAEMIREWNLIVRPKDLIYILGDVAFCQAQKAAGFVNSLNGDKILIQGNHDIKTVKDPSFRAAFKEIHNYLEVNYNGHKICMCHYPIYDHNQSHRGSLMLHGHRHGKPTGIPGRIMDVGFDATGKIVSQLDDVVNQLIKVDQMPHH